MVAVQLFMLWSLLCFFADVIVDLVDDIGVNPGFQESFV